MNVIQIILFYILSFTWGAIMSIIGGIVGLILTIMGHKPQRLGHIIYWQVGQGWGGVELGCFFICCKNCGNHTKWHEAGHGIQNTWFGPLMPFVICLPSCIRYWIREFNTKNKIDKFLLIILIISTVIFGTLIVIGSIHKVIWLIIISTLCLCYILSLLCWVQFKERNNLNDPYDKIWFEGQATKLGTIIFSKK